MRALHDAVRHLRRSPGFSIAAVLSLALGIGATTGIFTLLDALLLRPLSVREPDRLIRISGVDAQGQERGIPTPVLDLLRQRGMFDGVCGFNGAGATIEMQGGIASRSTHAMTGDCFETLGVVPALGRVLGPADDVVGAPRAAVVTYEIWSWLMIRTKGDPGHIIGPMRRELHEMGREYAYRVRTLTEDRDASLAQERLLASLSIAFGWVGLTLAAIGLYGLLNFSVTRRTGEIGLRMALGAERAHIFRLVIREALVLIVTGVAIGLPITLAGAHAVRTLLHGVDPFGLTLLASSIAVLIVVGALATWIPARRAAAVAPSEALRSE
ncbi:MAG: FtsX-like permease family protein [Vicinamibacteraceae bacterium]